MKKQPLFELVLFVVALVWSGLSLAATPIDETRKLNADANLSVENIAGSVTVTGWDRNELHLTGSLGDGVEELVIEGDANELEIRVEYPDRADNMEETILELRVPRGVELDVETVSADIAVSELQGALSLQTVSGDTDVRASTEELSVQSVSGDIAAEGKALDAEFQTVSGDIEAQLAEARDISINTVSGDGSVKVESELQALEMETVSGDLSADFTPATGAEVEASTLSGELSLVMPANVSAQINATTFSGEIFSDFAEDREEEGDLHVTLGDGGASINIESFSGEVEILKR